MPRPITGETPLARLRIAAGLSQRELAERLGTISEPGIHRWETGRTRPSVDILPMLAKILGVSPSWLRRRLHRDGIKAPSLLLPQGDAPPAYVYTAADIDELKALREVKERK